MDRPNVLYLHTHDLGRYCQPYGYAIATPNMQQLAEDGVLFRQAFAAAPTCSPARAALLTGKYPHSCGMLGLVNRGFSLADAGQHIVHTLRKAGYHSALIGTQHVLPDASEIGYDEVNICRKQDRCGRAAEGLAGAPPQPFFLSVGFNDTHRTFPDPGPADDPRYCRPPAPIPDTPETRRDMAGFMAAARGLDEKYGLVLAALDRASLADNTLVICTTDHGIAFPEMKCNLNCHGLGVTLIMRGPGGLEGGRVCDALVSQVDIFPTLCDLIGIDLPEGLQGRSMMPLIRGEADEINEEIFSEVTYHAAYEPMRAVRTRRFNYIRRFGGRRTPVLPNCDDGASKQLWLDHGWKERPVAQEQLYDLVFDPNEANNLAGDPAMSGVLEDMRGRLARFMRETDDPLLSGPVPAPPGATFNDPDGLSPREPLTEA